MAYVKVCVFCRTESDIKKLITPYLGQQEDGSSKLWDSYTVVHFFGKHILAAETNFDYFIMADGNIVAKYDLSLVVLGFDETALSCVFHLRLNQYMDQSKSQGLYMAHLSCHE